ncbi:MAG: hypothetical protein J7L21_00075, partial [Sulfurimonas sp.]|nr:hypothetical protein [Sulfurimonas sp.]
MKDSLEKSVRELIVRIDKETTEVKDIFAVVFNINVEDLHKDTVLKFLAISKGFNEALESNGLNPEDLEMDAYMD